MCRKHIISSHTHTHTLYSKQIPFRWFRICDIDSIDWKFLEGAVQIFFFRSSSPNSIIHSVHTKSQLISLCIIEMCVGVCKYLHPLNNFARTALKRERGYIHSFCLAEQEVKKKKKMSGKLETASAVVVSKTVQFNVHSKEQIFRRTIYTKRDDFVSVWLCCYCITNHQTS